MIMNEDRNDEQTRKKNFKLSYKNLFLTKRAEMKQGNKKNNIKLNIRSTSIKKIFITKLIKSFTYHKLSQNISGILTGIVLVKMEVRIREIICYV